MCRILPSVNDEKPFHHQGIHASGVQGYIPEYEHSAQRILNKLQRRLQGMQNKSYSVPVLMHKASKAGLDILV